MRLCASTVRAFRPGLVLCALGMETWALIALAIVSYLQHSFLEIVGNLIAIQKINFPMEIVKYLIGNSLTILLSF